MVTATPEVFGIRNSPPLSGRRPNAPESSAAAQMFSQYGEAGRRSLAEPFKGITTDGRVVPGLFSIEGTGVSTKPILDAADAFLGSLNAEQHVAGLFGIDDQAWRAWSNVHPFVMRHGVLLDGCTQNQRDRALDLVRATCSARGFELARDVMRLNDALAEITGRNDEYGEWLYWMSMLGQPSQDAPWGWQIDGHHLVINCFVLGDQIVMTPAFFGSEPTSVASGRHAGTRVFEAEEQQGIDFVRGLPVSQRATAIAVSTEGILRAQRMDGRVQAVAFRDNIQLPYAGLAAGEMAASARNQLLDLIELYVGRMRDGHARVKIGSRHLFGKFVR